MNDRYVAILSGDNVALGSAELRALLRIFNQDSTAQPISRRMMVFEASDEVAAEIIRRAGYIKSIVRPIISERSGKVCESSLLIDNVQEVVHSPVVIRAEKLGVPRIDQNSRTIEKNVFDVLSRTIPDLRISYESPSTIIKIYVEGGLIIGGILIGEKDARSLEMRRPGKRPFTQPSAIHPKLARCMVNLTGARRNGCVLDPFMGTGSIPIEASLMGYTSIGVELKSWICFGGAKNIRLLGDYSRSHIVVGDSRTLMFGRRFVDGVATDPPYGRSTTILGGELSRMLEAVFAQLLEIVKKDARIVMALPEGTPFIDRLDSIGLRIEERLKERVHSSLIREIIVCSIAALL
jgi:tRNA (guanine10-N2)-dimethyltransferase